MLRYAIRQFTRAIARINHRIPHPVNPEILEILIQTINHRIPHPVNPEILEILIWLAPRYAIRQCTTAIAH
ncbi:MAG: hypothetical protein ACK55G_21275 [Dolichospermum sp.]